MDNPLTWIMIALLLVLIAATVFMLLRSPKDRGADSRGMEQGTPGDSVAGTGSDPAAATETDVPRAAGHDETNAPGTGATPVADTTTGAAGTTGTTHAADTRGPDTTGADTRGTGTTGAGTAAAAGAAGTAGYAAASHDDTTTDRTSVDDGRRGTDPTTADSTQAPYGAGEPGTHEGESYRPTDGSSATHGGPGDTHGEPSDDVPSDDPFASHSTSTDTRDASSDPGLASNDVHGDATSSESAFAAEPADGGQPAGETSTWDSSDAAAEDSRWAAPGSDVSDDSASSSHGNSGASGTAAAGGAVAGGAVLGGAAAASTDSSAREGERTAGSADGGEPGTYAGESYRADTAGEGHRGASTETGPGSESPLDNGTQSSAYSPAPQSNESAAPVSHDTHVENQEGDAVAEGFGTWNESHERVENAGPEGTDHAYTNGATGTSGASYDGRSDRSVTGEQPEMLSPEDVEQGASDQPLMAEDQAPADDTAFSGSGASTETRSPMESSTAASDPQHDDPHGEVPAYGTSANDNTGARDGSHAGHGNEGAYTRDGSYASDGRQMGHGTDAQGAPADQFDDGRPADQWDAGSEGSDRDSSTGASGAGVAGAGAAGAAGAGAVAAGTGRDDRDGASADRLASDQATAPSDSSTSGGDVFVESAYGAGSADPAEDGSGPAGWEVKGNIGSMLFHTADSPSYTAVRAEVWFESEEAARAAGFAHWDRRRR